MEHSERFAEWKRKEELKQNEPGRVFTEGVVVGIRTRTSLRITRPSPVTRHVV